MNNLQKLQNVATKTELYLIELDIRMHNEDFNNQPIRSFQSITSFFEPMTNSLISELQRRTWDVYGGAGMVVSYQILEALGFVPNHHILDK